LWLIASWLILAVELEIHKKYYTTIRNI
jgi:hypothetical protein